MWLDVVAGWMFSVAGLTLGWKLALDGVAEGDKSCLRSIALRQLKLKQKQELKAFKKGE
jgi:hypothetical protein